MLLTCGTDAAKTHLTTGFWYVDTGNVLGVADPAAAVDTNTNTVFKTRYNLMMQSKELELFGKLHADIFNVPNIVNTRGSNSSQAGQVQKRVLLTQHKA